MIRKFAALLALTALFTQAFSQEAIPSTPQKAKGRPDIPGTFLLEIGVNGAPKAPSKFDLGFWGSRTLNVYYQYDIRILHSKFSFVPGIGFSLERFKSKEGYILGYDAEDSLQMLTPTQMGFTSGIRKSQLITNYLDVPLEICFRTNPEDPSRSFKASVGGRFGYMFDSFTKVKYKDDGEVKKVKDKQDFNLSKFRYGVYGKVGAGNFSVFWYYNLSDLFQKDKGLVEHQKYVPFNTFTIGVSLASF